MKRSLFSGIAVLSLAVYLSVAVYAGDYSLDPTFAPVFTFPDFDVENSIADVYVQSDQKIMVGGTFETVNGVTARYLVRLNPDGSRDSTFNAALQPTAVGLVRTVTQLADGKYFITGRFQIGNTFPYQLRLNNDGSIDGTFTGSTVGTKVEPLAGGRFIVCGGRLINNQDYWIAHRINSDGSPDPGFHITSATGSCLDLAVQPDGKVIISASFQNGNNSPQERIQRFNTDGTRDMTFSGHMYDSLARKIELLPNGKVLAAYDFTSGQTTLSKVFRLNSDGSLDTELPCGVNSSTSTAFLPMQDGSVMMSGCRKWTAGPQYQFANIRTNGSIQPDLDILPVTGSISDIRPAGNGKFYVYGLFSQVNGVARTRIARVQPYTKPIKPKYDFDGDGRDDAAVFRPSDRYWYVNRSTAGALYFQWGLATDKPFAPDVDNDGRVDPAMVRNSIWYLLSSSSDYGYGYFQLGVGEGKPMSGDLNGDGKQDWAMWRGESFSVSWDVSLNGQLSSGYTTVAIPGETQDGIPVIGDFDGDGRAEIATFVRGNWRTRDYAPGAPNTDVRWGQDGDIPVPADYDGDGTTDFAVFRPSTGVWWLNRSSEGPIAARFGLNGDIPVPADYDGDGKTDIAIFRNGEWWQYLSSTGSVTAFLWGTAGDLPIEAQ